MLELGQLDLSNPLAAKGRQTSDLRMIGRAHHCITREPQTLPRIPYPSLETDSELPLLIALSLEAQKCQKHQDRLIQWHFRIWTENVVTTLTYTW